MKTIHLQSSVKSAIPACLLSLLAVFSSHAQYTFNSGSDGSYGPMNITTTNTLALPPDGIFRCTTINIASNATLRFTPNALNTPVYLLAQGDVTINGTIDVSGSTGTSLAGGAGGPGGFSGGNPGYGNLASGDGHGPGAGRAGTSTTVGSASYSGTGTGWYNSTNNGSTYGSPLLIPLVGGSGGGGRIDGGGGAGGGGAILIASNSRIELAGEVRSSSSHVSEPGSNYGHGSGGAVRLVAPVVSGMGAINVAGGKNDWNLSYYGGKGRVRIDCTDRHSLWISWSPDATVGTVGANMVVFPTNTPRLDITQVAGTNITVGTGAAVSFLLPQGAPTNQTVTIQAGNFGTVVPIRVALTPDHGSSSYYDASIDNTANPASITVPVVLPVNEQVQVNVWTR